MAEIINRMMGTRKGSHRRHSSGSKKAQKKKDQLSLSAHAMLQVRDLPKESVTVRSPSKDINDSRPLTDGGPQPNETLSKHHGMKQPQCPPLEAPRLNLLATPYILVPPIPEDGVPPPPYPPITAEQKELNGEQRSKLYRRPTVDLGRETFIPEGWRTAWKTSGQQPMQFVEMELKRKELVCDKERKFILFEEPEEIPSGEQGRRIVRYKVSEG